MFRNTRPPHNLAQQWAPLEDNYCTILLNFSDSMDDTAATIIKRVRQAIVGANVISIYELGIDLADLMAWVSNGENGWFSRVHIR